MALAIATYAASFSGLQPGTTPTDIFTIQAAASKLVQVLYADIAFSETTAGDVDIFLIKRSTANTTGTFTNPAATPLDSADAAAGATIFAYTVNPGALGTPVGTGLKNKLFGNVTTGQIQTLVYDQDKPSRKPFMLRPGSAETLAWNLNGIGAPAGASFDFNIIWTEE